MSDRISSGDKAIIRALAIQYAELANSERNCSTLARWRELNNMQTKPS